MVADAPNASTVRAADFYRGIGFNPLPSRTDASRPPMTYLHLWEKPASRSLFRRFPHATNIQVMCGVHWGLAVIDLDGPEALDAWDDYCRFRDPIRTWEVGHGPAGKHVWFAVPDGVESLPKRTLWEIPGRKHVKIELLGDHSLAVAPPSVHRSGERYAFLAGRSPLDLARPDPMPAWLVALARVPAPRPVEIPASLSSRKGRAGREAPLRYRRSDVLAAIPDPIGLAAGWGVRLAASRPNPSGWQRCHAIDRPDRDPSAAISVRGDYWDAPYGPGRSISLFDLSAALGVFPTWRDAVNGLGTIFGARNQEAHRVHR